MHFIFKLLSSVSLPIHAINKHLCHSVTLHKCYTTYYLTYHRQLPILSQLQVRQILKYKNTFSSTYLNTWTSFELASWINFVVHVALLYCLKLEFKNDLLILFKCLNVCNYMYFATVRIACRTQRLINWRFLQILFKKPLFFV